MRLRKVLPWLYKREDEEDKPSAPLIAPVDVETDDPLAAHVIAMAFNTGKPVFGHIGPDGKPHFEILEDGPKTPKAKPQYPPMSND